MRVASWDTADVVEVMSGIGGEYLSTTSPQALRARSSRSSAVLTVLCTTI